MTWQYIKLIPAYNLLWAFFMLKWEYDFTDDKYLEIKMSNNEILISMDYVIIVINIVNMLC